MRIKFLPFILFILVLFTCIPDIPVLAQGQSLVVIETEISMQDSQPVITITTKKSPANMASEAGVAVDTSNSASRSSDKVLSKQKEKAIQAQNSARAEMSAQSGDSKTYIKKKPAKGARENDAQEPDVKKNTNTKKKKSSKKKNNDTVKDDKDVKNSKDSKTSKDAKNGTKDSKTSKDTKNGTKDSKTNKDTKNGKDNKDNKDNKNGKDSNNKNQERSSNRNTVTSNTTEDVENNQTSDTSADDVTTYYVYYPNLPVYAKPDSEAKIKATLDAGTAIKLKEYKDGVAYIQWGKGNKAKGYILIEDDTGNMNIGACKIRRDMKIALKKNTVVYESVEGKKLAKIKKETTFILKDIDGHWVQIANDKGNTAWVQMKNVVFPKD